MGDEGVFSGRARVFGDDIDTDVMMPGRALRLPPEEAAGLLFDAICPGWRAGVQPGDIVVGGHNFGVGSARPVGSLFRRIGVRVVLAETMSSLFLRNCVNAGVYALVTPGIHGSCADGDELALDLATGSVTNVARGSTCRFAPPPPFVRDLVDAGGVLEVLRKDGYLRARASDEALEHLVARSAIVEVVASYAHGVDRNDWDLVRSCFHDDAYLDYGQVSGTIEDFIAFAVAGLGPMEHLMHKMGQTYLELDGDRARAETYALCFHRYRAGERLDDLTVAARYVDRFERRDVGWRIAHRVFVYDWTRIDPVLGELEDPRLVLGRRDGADPWFGSSNGGGPTSNERPRGSPAAPAGNEEPTSSTGSAT